MDVGTKFAATAVRVSFGIAGWTTYFVDVTFDNYGVLALRQVTVADDALVAVLGLQIGMLAK